MGAEIVVMCAAMGSAEEVQQHSAKLVSFIDLAGHEKYLKTTLSGMVRTHATTLAQRGQSGLVIIHSKWVPYNYTQMRMIECSFLCVL